VNFLYYFSSQSLAALNGFLKILLISFILLPYESLNTDMESIMDVDVAT